MDGASRTGQARPTKTTTTERASGSARDHHADHQAEQPPAPNAPEPAESSRFAGVTAAHCEHMVDYATSREPFVKFMVQKLAEAGCTVGNDFIKIRHCDAEVGGGFRAPDGVIVCYNHLASQEEVTHALTHELIHAYDHCRWVLTSNDDALFALPTALTRSLVRSLVRSFALSFAAEERTSTGQTASITRAARFGLPACPVTATSRWSCCGATIASQNSTRRASSGERCSASR